MLKLVLVQLLVVGSLAGCLAPASHDQRIQQAFLERETAYQTLEKAAIAYCLAKNISAEARQNCIFEKRLEVLQIRQAHEDSASGQISAFQVTRPQPDGMAPPLLKCERTGTQTTCQRSRQLLNAPSGG